MDDSLSVDQENLECDGGSNTSEAEEELAERVEVLHQDLEDIMGDQFGYLDETDNNEENSSDSEEDSSFNGSQRSSHASRTHHSIQTSNEHSVLPNKRPTIIPKNIGTEEKCISESISHYSNETSSTIYQDHKHSRSQLNNKSESDLDSDDDDDDHKNAGSQLKDESDSDLDSDYHKNAKSQLKNETDSDNDSEDDHITTTSELNQSHHSEHHSGVSDRVQLSVLHSNNDYYQNTSNALHSMPLNSDNQDPKSNYNSVVHSNEQDLDYASLHTLYQNQNNQLMQALTKERKYKGQIDSLTSDITLNIKQRDKLVCSLKELEKENVNLKNDMTDLEGKLSAIEYKLSAEKDAKEEVLRKLLGAEAIIGELKQKANDDARNENTFRLENLYKSNEEKMKLRHQKEVLQLNEKVEKLQRDLDEKVTELETLQFKVSSFQKKYEELEIEKNDTICKLQTNLNDTQKKYNNLLVSGTIANNESLKLEVQHYQKLNLTLEKENSSLKGEIDSLKGQLKTEEALMSVEVQSEPGLKLELQKSINLTRNLRIENHSLKEKLKEISYKLPKAEEEAKVFESRYTQSEYKIKELEKKLEEILPSGSIPMDEHKMKVKLLKEELQLSQRDLKEVFEKLEKSVENEEKLRKDIKALERKITKIKEVHKSEIKKIEEKCKKAEQIRIDELTQEHNQNHNKNLKLVCSKYEDEIAKLKKQILSLNLELDDAKSRFVSVCKENNLLEEKINSVLKPKDREEIEREVRQEYSIKFSKMVNAEKSKLETLFDEKLKKSKEDWLKETIPKIDEYVEKTKKHLDEQFIACQDKEKQNFQQQLKTNSEKLQSECKEKIKLLKQQYDEEKNNYATELREHFQQKRKQELKELQESHQKDMKIIKQNYERKILALESEVQVLKESYSKKSDEIQESLNSKQEFSIQREAWENEKLKLISSKTELEEKLSSALENENKFLEKKKTYHTYISSLKKKLNSFQSQNKELKKSISYKEKQIVVLMKQQQEKEMKKTEKEYRKHSALKSSYCQTEGIFVPKDMLINIQDKFIQCVKFIRENVETFLLESKKRTAESIHKALCLYHDHLMSKIFQDVARDARTIVPNYGVPRLNVNSQSSSSSRDNFSSPNTMQHQLHPTTKITNSTPMDNLASGDMHKKLHVPMSNITNAKTFQNERPVSDSAIRFEDVSFDFMPVQMRNPIPASVNFTDYSVPGGLFSHYNVTSPYLQRESAFSTVK